MAKTTGTKITAIIALAVTILSLSLFANAFATSTTDQGAKDAIDNAPINHIG
jgi:hypothetical protein